MAPGNLDNKGKGKAVLNDDDDISAPTMPVEAIGSSGGQPARSSAQAIPPAAAMAAPPLIHRGSQSQQLDKSLIVLIKCVMQQCVTGMEAANTEAANSALVALSSASSLDGDPIQRLTSAFAEALARRALALLQGLSWSVQGQLRTPPSPAYAGVARQWFHSLNPLLRGASLAANHGIVRAVEGEQVVHVVDLGGANPRQWIELLRLLAGRPGGAPSSLRLTIVSEHAFFLSCATELLTAEAARLHLSLAVHTVQAHIDNFSATVLASLGVQRGPALVLSSTLQLHRLIADTAVVRHADREHETMTRADVLLRLLRDLSPKVLVLTEQEADHNNGEGRGAGALWDRVNNAFDYYAVLFNELEVSGVPRGSLDRAVVERLHLREEIMDIVARDGAARRERHEKMQRWVPRMAAAGFQPVPVTMDGFREATRLDRRRSTSDADRQRPLYRVTAVKEMGCFYVHSCSAPMFSVSFWQPAPPRDDQQ
ncbi:scarecrow-like protein 3 [Sorghum bicolor]|uniref:Uncharacterized protein n=1 Tax=Sorghum bicolor TaxID=4558 RepID=A0A1Z5R369_SORBI|nr:scarecrow-like protein 3 [Sorghum bicolor]OQU77885.1 hypothetical protein SORBI_3009G117800 [Sorghum bicolor]|eukprot:XP_021303829.1 scarecrow-like protein 3 [Sorghum bicolor]